MNEEYVPSCQLISVEEAASLIATCEFYWIAGDLGILRELPKGNWIGGSIPYFQIAGIGLSDRKKVLLGKITRSADSPKIQNYDIVTISDICSDAPLHGYTHIMLATRSSSRECSSSLWSAGWRECIFQSQTHLPQSLMDKVGRFLQSAHLQYMFPCLSPRMHA